MFDGQSLGNAPFLFPQTYPRKYQLLAHPEKRLAVANNNGTSYTARNVNIGSRLDSLFQRSIHTVLFDDGGTEEVTTTDAATLLNTMTAYTTARRAAGADKIVKLAIPPNVVNTGPMEAVRVAVNAALKANPKQYGYDYFVDLMEVPELTNTGNAAYYSDGTHYTDAATTLVAAKIDATVPRSI